MGRPPTEGVTITQTLLGEYASYNVVRKSAQTKRADNRLELDINDLESVVCFLARHGSKELRKRIVGLAASALLDDETPGAPREVRLARKEK